MQFIGEIYHEVVDWVVTHFALLFPAGNIAASERDLMVAAFLLMLVVVIPVFLMTVVIAVRYRESNTKAHFTPNWDHNVLHETIWWGVPIAIVLILSVISWNSTHALDPYKPIESPREPLVIQTISLNWKWLFLYPKKGIATMNSITIPEGTPIIFRITSDAPMNALWMPEVSGMIMTMPGMITELNIIVPEVGVYRGMSSNYSGNGFAGMDFTINVVKQGEFARFVEKVKEGEKVLTASKYQELAKNSRNEPVAYYRLDALNLFRTIVMSYMMPGMNKNMMEMEEDRVMERGKGMEFEMHHMRQM